MRRFVLTLFLSSAFLSAVWLVTRAVAQETPDEPTPTIVADPLHVILLQSADSVSSTVSVEPIPVSAADIASVSGVDSCASATTPLPFDYENDILEVGSPTDVSAFTTDASDPVLISCMEGSYNNPRGYRTAWFKVVAPVSGVMIAEVATNSDYKRNYDTVVAIYSDNIGDDSCSSLSQLMCNDNHNGILSNAQASVTYNQTYYILVADRNQAASGQLLLDLNVSIETGDDVLGGSGLGNQNGAWSVSNTILDDPLTRHTVVVQDTDVYILGGQKGLISNSPDRVGELYRFDTVNETLEQLSPMNASPAPNGGRGYSNADAMIVANEIHYPMGYIGSAGGSPEYSTEQWIYNIDTDTWGTLNDFYPTATSFESSFRISGLAYTALVPYSASPQEGFYVTGGIQGTPLSASTPYTDTVIPSNRFFRYLYNTNTNGNPLWQEFTSMSSARYAHMAATLEDDSNIEWVCVVGGLSFDNIGPIVINNGECYNATTNSWDNTKVGDMNIPRYGGHSAVAPDGTWYVFGGAGTDGQPIAEVEAFDINTGQWTIMAPNYNLDNPKLIWPRGVFVGNNLWVFGGELTPNFLATGLLGSFPNSQISVKTFPFNDTYPNQVYLPLNYSGYNPSGNTFASAESVTLDTDYTDSFTGFGDVYNAYRFTTNNAGTYTISLDGQAAGADADFYIYNDMIELIGFSQEIGNTDESTSLSLDASSRYYILVARSSPPPNLEALGTFTLNVTSP